MTLLSEITPARVLDAVLALTLTLALGRIALFFASQPVVRRRICICTLLGCIISAPLAISPNLPRIHLGWLSNTQLLASNPRGDVGLISTGSSNGFSQHVTETPAPVPTTPASTPLHTTLWHALLALYLAGVTILTLRLLTGMALIHHYIATAKPVGCKLKQIWKQIAARSPVPLKISDTLPRPVTAGVLRPTVIIPQALAEQVDSQSLYAVLLHEFAHASRRDTLACLLASITHVVFFFHPLVWWATRDLRRSQELLADAWAAEKMGDAEKYVANFLELTRSAKWTSRLLMPVLEAYHRHSEFFHRMKFVLTRDYKVESRCHRGVTITAILIMLAGIATGLLSISPKPSSAPQTHSAAITPMETRGIQYLLSKQQPDGGWMTQYGPGITAAVVKALLRADFAPDSPEVTHALTYLESTQQPDGGFYVAANPSYNTAIVVSTLAMINNPRIQQRVERAHAFIQSMRQAANAAATQSKNKRDSFYHAAAEVEALHTMGVPSTDPGIRAACYEIISAANDAGERADSQRLPRYGTMTYAELKSLLYAGLSRDDPRVKGVLACIQEYYTLEHNPGDGSYRGQFYFYHSLAKALRAYGEDIIVDARGQRHDWKQELSERLAGLQRPDGSWINSRAQEYLEHDPVLVTTYCVLALQEMRDSGR